MRIVILEDNSDRQEVMSSVIADVFPGIVAEFFVTAQQMIAALSATGIYDIALISLDNDLEMIETDFGRLIDAGDGIDVAKWLTTLPPVVPVVIHTTNTIAGDQIEHMLGANGWICARVVPYDGESWIRERWRSIVRNLIVSYSPDTNVSSVGIQILNHGLKKGIPADQSLRDILRVASIHTRGGACEDDLSFELAYLGSDDILRSVVGVGFSSLSDIGFGTSREIVECSAASFGIGPIAPSHETLESCFRSNLASIGVREIQFDVVRPDSEHDAVLLTASKSTLLDLCSHKIQANIRETRALLELGLLMALKERHWQFQADLGTPMLGTYPVDKLMEEDTQ